MFNLFRKKKNQLQKPGSQLEEVLYYLIKRDSISRKQIMFDCGILNLPARIGDLRHNHCLDIKLTSVKTKNKFGREITYGQYSLRDKEKGIKRYNQIIKTQTR